MARGEDQMAPARGKMTGVLAKIVPVLGGNDSGVEKMAQRWENGSGVGEMI